MSVLFDRLKKFFKNKKILIFFACVFLIFFARYFFPPSENIQEEKFVISDDKIVQVEVEYLSFSGEEKTLPIYVMDVLADDVVQIFKELKKIQFPDRKSVV